jgi:hypothetical protein
MGEAPKPPDPKPPTPMPDDDSPAARSAKTKEIARASSDSGREATVLTGRLGDPGAGGKTSLLG